MPTACMHTARMVKITQVATTQSTTRVTCLLTPALMVICARIEEMTRSCMAHYAHGMTAVTLWLALRSITAKYLQDVHRVKAAIVRQLSEVDPVEDAARKDDGPRLQFVCQALCSTTVRRTTAPRQ